MRTKVAVAGCVLSANAALAQETVAPTLPKSGAFGAGVGVEALGIGPAQAFGPAGIANGVALSAALQIDLGPHWAFRLPAAVDVTLRDSKTAFVGVGLSPGALYRWRHSIDQPWVPYAGAGLRLAGQTVHRSFINEPLIADTLAATNAVAFDIDDHDSHGGSSDRNKESSLSTVLPELWVGAEWHPTRWFALNLGVVYAWTRARGHGVHLLRESVAMRFTF